MLKGVFVGLILTYSLLINSAKGKPQYNGNLYLPQSGPSASASPEPHASVVIPQSDPANYYPAPNPYSLPASPILQYPSAPQPYNPYDNDKLYPYSANGSPQPSLSGGETVDIDDDADNSNDGSTGVSRNYAYVQQVSSNSQLGSPLNLLNAVGRYMKNPQSIVQESASAVSLGSNPQLPFQGFPLSQSYPVQGSSPYLDNPQSYFQEVSTSDAAGNNPQPYPIQGLPSSVPYGDNSQSYFQEAPPQLSYRLRRSSRLIRMPSPQLSADVQQPAPPLQSFQQFPLTPSFPVSFPIPLNIVKPNLDPGVDPAGAKLSGFY
ncbi:hypothetical protein ILUMI_08044 [Ignelater luminosus]|uniref:Uncharacterized protein n=1 Tax=Ignelater luminosus TaxID=2038154 RepID=A0A8K0D725_IGNLU|nr:hypothetical protein ILUMI_08044 [Ignelater luminosus]